MAFKTALTDFVHLFYPHVCDGCGSDIIETDHRLCLHCLTELPATNFFMQAGNPVERTFYGRLPLRHGGAAYFFTKDSLLQTIIHQLKYRNNQDIGLYMGKMMGRLIAAAKWDDIDAIVPLPLNPKRQQKRGYNQALLLAMGIASVWNRPVLQNAMKRRLFTETQTKKDRISRWQNMDGAFVSNSPDDLLNKHLLLVDDVVTTGASLEACGNEMLKVTGTTLSVATLAYTF